MPFHVLANQQQGWSCLGNPHCLRCSNASRCDLCDNRKWDGVTCVDCSEHCETCDTENGCTKCSDGYFLSKNGQQCLSCMHCAGTCTDGTGCALCERDHMLLDDGRCAGCPEVNSQTCGICSRADRGQYWWQMTCNECPEHCLHCIEPDSCLDCGPNKGWYSGACRECKDIPVWRHESHSSCKTCGNYVNDVGSCRVCSEADRATIPLACTTCSPSIWYENACYGFSCWDDDLTETQCDICSGVGLGRYWVPSAEVNQSRCVAVDCNTVNTEQPCNSCAEKYWNGTFCVDMLKEDTCSLPASQIRSMVACRRCPNKFWLSGVCTDAACEQPGSPEECDACDGRHWDGNDCIFLDDIDCHHIDKLLTKSVCEVGCLKKHGYPRIWTDNAQCVACPDRCESCEVVNPIYGPPRPYCTRCEHGYVTVEGHCQACSSVAMDSAEKCHQCKKAWHNGNCEVCPLASVSVLNQEAMCFTCGPTSSQGVYFHDGSCRECLKHCKRCTDGQSCEECSGPRYLSRSPAISCDDCSPGCLSCHSWTDCSLCESFKYWDVQLIQCVACVTGCEECADSYSCAVCAHGYCLDVNTRTCIKTGGQECRTCSVEHGHVTCHTCTSGFSLEVCEACEDTHCISCPGWKSKCNACQSGYYYSNGTCKVCPGGERCLECNSATWCFQCQKGTYYDPVENACHVCGDGCTECVSSTTCEKCAATNMFWDITTFTCTSCIQGCVSCRNSETCVVCSAGFSLNEMATCTACPERCIDCSTDGETCLECVHGSYLHPVNGSHVCDDCDPLCKRCQYTRGDPTCSACYDGYYLHTQTSECKACHDLVPFCALCSPSGCIRCQDGYQLGDASQKCLEACYSCVGPEENCTSPADMVACPGLGQDAFCWRGYRRDLSQSTTTHTLACHDSAFMSCSSREQSVFCFNNQQVHSCLQCCTTPLCNDRAIVTRSGANGVVLTMNILILPVLNMFCL